MSNARSLSARRQHGSLLRSLFRAAGSTVLWCGIALGARTELAFAQGCPATHTLTGNISPADGSSTAATSTPVWVVDAAGNDLTWGSVPYPGGFSANWPPLAYGVGSYTFRAHPSFYHPEPGGSGSCVMIPNCGIRCTGNISVGVYSKEGSVSGTITYQPDGAPAEGVRVRLYGSIIESKPADPNGIYKFAADPFPQNNWGISAARAGNSGPGSSLHHVYVDATDLKPVTVTSNGDTKQNFEIERSGPQKEPDPRCNSGSQSSPGPSASASGTSVPSAPKPPCTVGCPVSVTTGNVDVDQTDAVIPGRGLGLRFARSYNSANSTPIERYGVFGPGWNHSYEKRLTFPWPGSIKLRNSNGTITYFSESPTIAGTYTQTAPYSNESRIVNQPGSNLYVREFLRGGQEIYDRLTPPVATARLVSLTDPAGNITALTYDTGNKLTTIADAGGRQLTLGYVGAELRTLTGPGGLIATFTYASGRLSTVTYADGDGNSQPDGGYTFAYHATGNGAGKLSTVTDLSGRVTETQIYDANGRAIETSISGNVEKYTLDYQADKTIVTDSLGNETEYHFQTIWGSKRITKTIGSCSSCGGGGSAIQEWNYDAKGRITSHTDGEGNRTDYTYDNDGNLVLIEAPELDTGVRHTTQLGYDTSGRLVSRIAPNLATTTWTHVAAGPATITEEVSTGVTRTTTIEYWGAGRRNGKVRYVRDPLNRQTSFDYSIEGDLASVVDAASHTTMFQYDLMGRRTKTVLPVTTPANDSPTTSYDTLGRVWKITNPPNASYPTGSYWQNTYDGGGRRTIARDPDGHETTYVYDSYGRLSTVTNSPDGTASYVTEYRYDEMSNLRYLIDPRQYPQPSPVPATATEFRYEDGHNRVTEVRYPGNLVEEFTYDLAGRLSTRIDRKGVTTTFLYDPLGRLTEKSYSDGTDPVTFTYDAGDDTGFLTGASNPADTLSWDYDRAGQMLSEASTRNATTVSYQYFLSGEREKLRLNGVDVLTYAYQTDGQLDTLTRAAGVVFDFTTDAAHRRQLVTFPNNTSTEYGYDTLSRLSLIRLRRAAIVLNTINYESNELNNRTSRTENGTRLQYTYDHVSRLDTVQQTLPSSVLKEDYSYDPVGNRLTALGIPGTWSYNDRNELTSYNGINFTYDLNGNQLTRSGTPLRTNTWDVENKLTAVVDDGVTKAQFEYDPLGRRVAKNVPFALSGAGLTRFAYDGEDILFEQGPSGNFTYLHGPGIDEPLARETSTGVRTYYHADGLGSIIKGTDAAGAVIASQAYDSFGGGTSSSSGYGFTGRDWDSETDLAGYRMRYLDPQLGRFLSEDPIKWFGGINLYAYVGNDPANFVDPYGLRDVHPSMRKHDVDGRGWPVGLPDFYQAGCSLSFFTIGGSYTPGMGAVPAGGFNIPKALSCSCSITGNWILGENSKQETYAYTTGSAASAGGFKIVGGQVATSGGKVSVGVGLGAGISLSPTYGAPPTICQSCDPTNPASYGSPTGW